MNLIMKIIATVNGMKEEKVEKEYIYAPYFTTNNHLLILNLSEFFPGTIQFYGTIVKAFEFEETSFKSKVFKSHCVNKT